MSYEEQTVKEPAYLAQLGDDSAIIDGVLDWFRIFASVPHGSWNEKALADRLEAAFTDLGWAVERDEWNNMKVDVPGAPGLEQLPPVILQGHIDMVCAVAAGSGYVPERDPITLVIEDGILRSDRRSSLGADCGLGLSQAFFVAGRPLRRGPIRLLLTVAEENGLEGAILMNPAWLAGCRWLINVDGGSADVVIVSSAGSRRECCTRPLETVPAALPRAFELKLGGLRGGHSGAMIYRGRGNAIKLLSHFLSTLREKTDYELAALRGGNASNAIPAEAMATLLVSDGELLAREAEAFREQLSSFYKVIDPDVTFTLREVARPDKVWSAGLRDDTLDLINLLHDGVFARHDTIPGQVIASANVGRCLVNDRDEVEIAASIRTHEGFTEGILANKHRAAARRTGFSLKASSYSGYAGSPDNPLALTIDGIHREQLGSPMKICAVHAGLEMGPLSAKNPALTMVTIGPDHQNGHATGEQAPLDRQPVFARLLAGTLERLAVME